MEKCFNHSRSQGQHFVNQILRFNLSPKNEQNYMDFHVIKTRINSLDSH